MKKKYVVPKVKAPGKVTTPDGATMSYKVKPLAIKKPEGKVAGEIRKRAAAKGKKKV